jgi:hypothetical protein
MVAVSSKDAKNALDDAEDVHCTASYVEDRKPRAYRKVTRARWRKFGTRLKRQGGGAGNSGHVAKRNRGGAAST